MAAQPPYRQEILPGVSSLDVTSGRACPRLADIDGDGNDELVVGSFSDGFQLFRAVATTSGPPTFVGVPKSASPFGSLTMPSSSDPILADLDGDGGNPFRDVQAGVGGMMDIDGDGDLDFLLGTQGGRLVFYRSAAVLFYDGFESGDLAAWDSASR